MLLALGSSLCWGVSAFLAGTRGRTIPATVLVWASQAVGIVPLALLLAARRTGPAATGDLAAGALAGIGTAVALSALYRGMAVGRAAVVAPLAAVVSVVVPTVVDLARGTTLSPMTRSGLALGTVAVWLLARARPDEAGDPAAVRPSGARHGIVAGLGFALFTLALDAAGPGAGAWPLLAARGATFVLLALVLVVRRTPVRPSLRGGGAVVAAVGALEILGAFLYLVAVGVGPLSAVTVLAALYPAVTVLLARAVLGQRLGRIGSAGFAVALGAVVLVLTG